MNTIEGLIQVIRPKQWIKNAFVFIPLFFGGSLLDPQDLWAAFVTFISFSLAASSIYCFNDVVDVEADRKHPIKCHRPVAAGIISVKQAYGLMVLMILLAMLTILLKQYAILDVCIIAFGFVLRILAGGEATDIMLTNWIVLMTFLLTLFLSFAKRRDDVLRMNETGEAPRKNTSRYNLTFINQAITITSGVTLVCYIMYTVSPEVTERFHTQHLYLTSVFVLLGLLRYIQIAVVDKKSGDPTKVILKDHFTQLIVLAWVLSFLFFIYIL